MEEMGVRTGVGIVIGLLEQTKDMQMVDQMLIEIC